MCLSALLAMSPSTHLHFANEEHKDPAHPCHSHDTSRAKKGPVVISTVHAFTVRTAPVVVPHSGLDGNPFLLEGAAHTSGQNEKKRVSCKQVALE